MDAVLTFPSAEKPNPILELCAGARQFHSPESIDIGGKPAQLTAVESDALYSLKLSPEQLKIFRSALAERLLQFSIPEQMPALDQARLKKITAESAAKMSAASAFELLSRLSEEDQQLLGNKLLSGLMEKLSPAELVLLQQARLSNFEYVIDCEQAESGESQAADTKQKYRAKLLPELLSNSTAALRHESSSAELMSRELNRRLRDNSDSMTSSRRALQFAEAFRILAESLPKEQSAKASVLAAKFYSNASQALFERPALDFSEVSAEAAEAGRCWQASARNWNRTEKTLRVVRNGSVLIVAGGAASIAAPIVFTAAAVAGCSTTVCFIASTATGTAVGSWVGLGLGGGTSVIENTGHVLLGNKDTSTAWRDIKIQTASDVKNSAISGASAGVGGGVGAYLNPAGAALPILQAAKNGASSALASNSTSLILRTGERMMQCQNEIDLLANAGSDPDSSAAGQNNLRERYRLSPKQLLADSSLDLLYGTAFGAFGGSVQFERQRLVDASFAKNILLDAGEWSTSTAAGVVRAYLELPASERTAENLLPIAADHAYSNFASTMTGRIAASPGAKNPEKQRSKVRPTTIIHLDELVFPPRAALAH